MLINSLLVPQIVQRAVKEVDYNTFMQMTYDKQIDEVQVQDNQIVFTAKDDKTIYKTGLMDDPDRTQRLYDSGAKFSSEIVEEASPILSFLISWLLPLIIIIGFGQLMYRQMAKKAGGDSMMFGMGGMGKSNAKVVCEVFQRYQVHRSGRHAFTDGVDLIDKYDAGSLFLCLFEQVSDLGGTHTYEHLHEFRTGNGEEGHVRLSGYCLGQHGLSCSGRSWTDVCI